MSWAVSATAPSASAKLVLICLSNYADARGRCWPTIATLTSATQLPERAVRDSLRLLIGANLLREDAGTTSSKRVFTLALPGEAVEVTAGEPE